MNTKMKGIALAVALAMGAAVSPPSLQAAGIPVIDVAGIIEAVRQYEQMVLQLKQLEAQLGQAKQQFQSMTGGRGMENIMSGESRNSIPSNWQETLTLMQGGEIGGLAKSIKQNASKIDTDLLDQVAATTRDQHGSEFDTAANRQAIAGTAYNNASDRFARLQSLMDAIPGATDMKAIADLQARIQVEQVMLQNEAIKLQSYAEMNAAQDKIERLQMRELATDRAHDGGPIPSAFH